MCARLGMAGTKQIALERPYTLEIMNYRRIFFRHSLLLPSFLRSLKTYESPLHAARVPSAAKCALRFSPRCFLAGSRFLCFLAIVGPQHVCDQPSGIDHSSDEHRTYKITDMSFHSLFSSYTNNIGPFELKSKLFLVKRMSRLPIRLLKVLCRLGTSAWRR